MEKSKITAEPVYLSDAELKEKINSEEIVIKLSSSLCKKIHDKFYGGYNGTPPMGQAPNAIIISLSKE